MDPRGQELFAQYRAISAKLKKRFMKKPNVKEASEDYGKLANRLKNEDNPHYSAMCFQAMAKCDRLMGDSSGEAEAWANAGRQFFTAEELLFSAHHASYRESLDAGVHCFIMAVDAHERKGDGVMAVMFCLELAGKLVHFERFHEASRFFQRAIDLQVNKPECQLQTLQRLASCKLRLRAYDGALNVYTRIFSETKGKEGPYLVLGKRCEVCILLLLLMLQIPERNYKTEHSMIIESYSKSILDMEYKETDHSLNRYILLQSLINASRRKDYKEIEAVRASLWSHLDEEQQHLMHLLMEVHCPYRRPLL
jgi:tetratricopeptide (TPR) repeat protein